MVVHLIRVQIDFGELIAEDEQPIVFVQSLNKRTEVEVLNDIPNILAESVEVVIEVEGDIVGVGFQSRQVVLRGVVETGVCLFQNNLR